MPLKEVAVGLVDELDPSASTTGAVNTIRLHDGRRSGWNTDVDGMVRALQERGVPPIAEAVLLGSGATSRSALLALHRFGVREVTVAGRTPANVDGAVRFARGIGLEAAPVPEGLGFSEWPAEAQLVVSTLPGDAAERTPMPRPGLALFDVAYAGSPLAARWRDLALDAPIVEGIDMLVHQALLQVRVFFAGDAARPLPDEERVLRAMNAAVGRS